MSGRIEGITGPMYSGKTEEMLRRLQRAKIAGQKVQFLTPTLDTRRGLGRVVSNGGHRIENYGFTPTPVHTVNPISAAIHTDTDVVGIDEVQFFSQLLDPPTPFVYRIVEEVRYLSESLGKRVLWSGLDMNFRAEPFGPVPILMAISTTTDKLTAVCSCGSQFATHSLRLVDDRDEVLVGAEKEYAARCLDCYLNAMRNR